MKTYNKAITTLTNAFFISAIAIFLGCFFKYIWLLLLAVIPVYIAIRNFRNLCVVSKAFNVLKQKYRANKQDLSFVADETEKLTFYQKKILYSLLLHKLSNKTCYSDDKEVIVNERKRYEMYSALSEALNDVLY